MNRTASIALLASAALLCWTASADTWNVMVRDGAGRTVVPYVSSLHGGETGTGAVRSEAFTLDADTVSFEMCGADGWPGQRNFKNWFALCDADSGLALRRVPPPGHDQMTPVTWDVVELIGRRVYFRAVDGLDDTAFAWIGWKNVRVGDRDLMPGLTPGRLPDGWIEEKRPEDVSIEQWLECRPASGKWALEPEETTYTWGVITFNGVRQTCAPYLSSLKGGESGIGAVRSPGFTLDLPEYTFVAMGADTPTGDAGLNMFQLVDADTSEILRRAQPPVGNTLVPITWDTSGLVGRRVFFRAVDGNSAPSWAWIGCDRIPLGKGRVAKFADPGAIEGWREEGRDGGRSLDAAAKATLSLAEMVQDEWRTADRRRGVRWNLWESNQQAAPYIMRRLARIMEDDFQRGRQLLREFRDSGAPGRELYEFRVALRDMEGRFADLQKRPTDAQGWRELRDRQQLLLRQLAFANPLLDFDNLLFVKRFTQQSYADINVNHHAWGSRPGGDICIISGLRSAGSLAHLGDLEITELIRNRLGPGNVHGIDLDWDAGRIVFAYTKSASGEPPDGWLIRQRTFDLHRTVDLLHLYEMNIDGSDLRQLTDGQWSDLNPCYLPNGDICFESERCGFSLQCNEYDKDEPTTNLYVLHRDSGEIRRLSVTKDGDWYPRVDRDGSIIYSHWEYHERSLVYVHPLWKIRPDGTGGDAHTKQHFNFPVTLTVPRPIPRSNKIMALAAGHHTLASGPVVLVDRAVGINEPGCIERISGPDIWPEYGGIAPGPRTPGLRLPPGQGWYMDPYPLSETTYLASYCDGSMQDEAGYALYLMDAYGGRELIYRDPAISAVMPVPLRTRVKPPVVADARATETDDATCIVTNITEGVPELERGAVRSIRIAEPVAWPYTNEIGGQRYEPDAKSTGVNWTPVRILGTVPVEEDGSAYFRVPADTALYFQILDANGMELRRMRTYVSFQPGETRGCTGCHETRATAPPLAHGMPRSVTRAASRPEPPAWGDKPLSFLRDVQPVLTRNCLSCHSGLEPAGGIDLSPGLTADYNRAYDSLMAPGLNLVSVSSKNDDARVTPVGEFGARKSKLLRVLKTTHANRCALEPEDWTRLLTWMDANAVYHDEFIRKRPESDQPYSIAADGELWEKIGKIHERRCAQCHDPASLTRADWVDLNAPERSVFIVAPMAGMKTPSGKTCSPAVYANADDPDCAEVLRLLEGALEKTWERPRRDLRCMAGGRPSGTTKLAGPVGDANSRGPGLQPRPH